jgi:hypothetical protein
MDAGHQQFHHNKALMFVKILDGTAELWAAAGAVLRWLPALN